MANRIFLNQDNIVEAVIEGEQTYMTFDNLTMDAQALLVQLQKEGKPRLGLIDITNQKNFTADTNRAAMQILESLNYDKVAIFGAKTLLTEVTKAIILAMGKTNNTKIFPDRDSAVAWLKSTE
ncbi:hypothetical protein EBZ57_02230 [bacterium]|nr:hypothetical protein [bacterium]